MLTMLHVDSEIDDLERSHAYLTDLVERQGIPVFSHMDTALECTAKSVQQVCVCMCVYVCVHSVV